MLICDQETSLDTKARWPDTSKDNSNSQREDRYETVVPKENDSAPVAKPEKRLVLPEGEWQSGLLHTGKPVRMAKPIRTRENLELSRTRGFESLFTYACWEANRGA